VRVSQTAIVICSTVFPYLAQAQAGAKAAFIDRSSDVVVMRVSTQPVSGNQKKTAAPQKLYVPAVTGLMYWIEMRDEKNQLVRVNANRQFKTGERIRLHVTSNVNGALTILQGLNSEPPELLFPPAVGGDNRVEAYKEKIFPSETGFFRFNSKAGNIRLLLMVQATGVPESETPASRPTAPARPTTEVTKAPAQRPAPTQVATAARVTDMIAEIKKAQGSKKLEIDDSPTTAAIYEVVDARKNPSVPPGIIAVEVNLVQTVN
jgi:hypothetical protein